MAPTIGKIFSNPYDDYTNSLGVKSGSYSKSSVNPWGSQNPGIGSNGGLNEIQQFRQDLNLGSIGPVGKTTPNQYVSNGFGDTYNSISRIGNGELSPRYSEGEHKLDIFG